MSSQRFDMTIASTLDDGEKVIGAVRSHFEGCNDRLESYALEHLAKRIHEANKAKGFWDDKATEVEKLFTMSNLHALQELIAEYRLLRTAAKAALIGTESSEMIQELRKPGENKEQEECADILIRTLDYAAARGFAGTLGETIRKKLQENAARPPKHNRLF